MQLGHPQALWLLLFLPLLLLLFPVHQQRQNAFRDRLGDGTILQQTPFRFPSLHRVWVRILLLTVPLISFVVALADPQLPRGPVRLPAKVIDVVMLIDVSKSMLAEDYSQKSRLWKAQQMARQLLPALYGNRVGLITFAGNSFRQAELTEDFIALDFILKHWVTEGSSGVGGSDLYRALETSLTLFPKGATRKKVVVLFSDGGDQHAGLEETLTKIARLGVSVLVYGLGSLQPSRIPRYDRDHTFMGYLQKDGQILTTRLNEVPLKQIATSTKGRYWRVTDQAMRPTLLSSKSVLESLLTQDKQKVFQPFLFTGLLACGMQLLRRRL